MPSRACSKTCAAAKDEGIPSCQMALKPPACTASVAWDEPENMPVGWSVSHSVAAVMALETAGLLLRRPSCASPSSVR